MPSILDDPRVDKSGGPDSCWIWTGSRDKARYGRVVRGKKKFGVHRVAYEERNGPIPNGILICHKCDNPPCLNPNHLFAGTPRDNMKDMTRKGRNYIPGFKLSESDVLEIVSMLLPGTHTERMIARRFGVSQVQINAISCGRSRKGLTSLYYDGRYPIGFYRDFNSPSCLIL